MKLQKVLPALLLLSVFLFSSCTADVPQQSDNIFVQVFTMLSNGFNFEWLQGNPLLFVGFIRALIFFLVFSLITVAIDNVPLFKNAGKERKGPKIVISIIISLITVLVPTRLLLTFIFVYSTIAWVVLLLGPVALVIWYVVKNNGHTMFNKVINGLILIGTGLIVNTMNQIFKTPQNYLSQLNAGLSDVSLAPASAAAGIFNFLFASTNWLSFGLIIWGIGMILSGPTSSAKNKITGVVKDRNSVKSDNKVKKLSEDNQKLAAEKDDVAQRLGKTEQDLANSLQKLQELNQSKVPDWDSIINNFPNDIKNLKGDVDGIKNELKTISEDLSGDKRLANDAMKVRQEELEEIEKRLEESQNQFAQKKAELDRAPDNEELKKVVMGYQQEVERLNKQKRDVTQLINALAAAIQQASPLEATLQQHIARLDEVHTTLDKCKADYEKLKKDKDGGTPVQHLENEIRLLAEGLNKVAQGIATLKDIPNAIAQYIQNSNIAQVAEMSKVETQEAEESKKVEKTIKKEAKEVGKDEKDARKMFTRALRQLKVKRGKIEKELKNISKYKKKEDYVKNKAYLENGLRNDIIELQSFLKTAEKIGVRLLEIMPGEKRAGLQQITQSIVNTLQWLNTGGMSPLNKRDSMIQILDEAQKNNNFNAYERAFQGMMNEWNDHTNTPLFKQNMKF